MKKLGILASGGGTNFQAIIDACREGRLAAKPVIAISNNSQAYALERAQKAGIPTAHLSSVTHPDNNDLDDAMVKTLQQRQVDLLILAGYLKELGPRTLQTFEGRIINIHPSLLPRYGGRGMYGMNVHRAVIENGDKETGVTVHWVQGEYDTGPVAAQKKIPVLPEDTPESLADRVLAEEHELLIETISGIISGSITYPDRQEK